MPILAVDHDWTFFTVFQQLLIVFVILGHLCLAFHIVLQVSGQERLVRATAITTAVLIFLGSKALKITFADLIIVARTDAYLLNFIAIGCFIPAAVGIFVSQMTIRAIKRGAPFPIRIMLLVGIFTVSQIAYANYVALTREDISFDRAFIPNMCYSISVGLWIVFNCPLNLSADKSPRER